MAILFDTSAKRIILDTGTVTVTEIYSRWVDWVASGDNSKYLPAFRSLGGDDLGGGIFIPPYYFLINDWRIRPMESSHTLTVTGNLFVEGGAGDPIVPTIGNFNVLIRSVVPVQAQAFSTSGGGSGATLSQIENSSVLAKQSKLVEIQSDISNVAAKVWESPVVNPLPGSSADILSKTLNITKFIGLS